jgi:tetratricopeptide (TPR) repeat protein
VPDAERPPSRVTYAKKRAATLFNRGEALTRQEKWPDAEAAYREAIRLDPSVAKYHDELGDVLAMQNKWADAEASFRNAVRIMPANAEYMANLGVALHKLGRAKDALATLGKAVRLDPKNHQFQNGIGLFLFDTGDWDAAAQVFRTAIKLSPTTGVYVANLGYALFQQGETEQARTLAAQARKLGTKRHALFADLQRDDDDRKRLWQLVAANRLADALTLSRKLVQQRPTDANHRLDRARLELVLGDRKVAQSEAEKMLKQYPRDTNIIELRGQVALWQNDRATAQRFFRLALEIDPQSTKYHYNDGVAFFESGTYRMAQFEFLTAVAMEPNRYYGSYYYLGAVYDQLGYPGHAIASFQTYLRYDNESESAQSARQIIARLQKTRR